MDVLSVAERDAAMSGKAYVTAGNLDRRVALWKRALAPYERHPYDLKAETTALLVVDMQRDM